MITTVIYKILLRFIPFRASSDSSALLTLGDIQRHDEQTLFSVYVDVLGRKQHRVHFP